MDKIKAFYDSLPKTAKVFCYMAISTILAEVFIELKGLDQTLFVRILAQVINLTVVGIEEAYPTVRARIKK